MTERNSSPTYKELPWLILKALEDLGGSASIKELSAWLADYLGLSEMPDELEYRIAWGRTDLKRVDAIDNSTRGVWTITEVGRGIRTEEEICEKIRRWNNEWYKRHKDSRASGGEDEGNDISDGNWTEELLEVLRQLQPKAFERLCQRVLREAGFAKVEVTDHNDRGIDGTGVLRVSLLSFHVMFQCKRYSGSVGAREIRDFQGAMVGRADKGLFITTGRFTKEAELAAVRDGAPAIDLIAGIEFCELLKRFGLGVAAETKVQREFFERF